MGRTAADGVAAGGMEAMEGGDLMRANRMANGALASQLMEQS